jgi:hypothetical protein
MFNDLRTMPTAWRIYFVLGFAVIALVALATR